MNITEQDNTLTTTIQLKLLPTKEQEQLIQSTMNAIVVDFRVQDKIDKRTKKAACPILRKPASI